MKPQFKPEEIYLDLSKLSEEHRNNAKTLTGIKCNSERSYLSFSPIQKAWGYFDSIGIKGKTELTYTQFLEMMGETIGEKPKDILFDTWVNLFVGEKQANSEKERINSDGTLYIGEGLENYYKEQLERTGKFKVVSIDATSEEVLQVENNGWIKIESESIIPNGDYWMIENEENEIMAVFDVDEDTNQDSIRKYYSHYQPIIKPEPPKS